MNDFRRFALEMLIVIAMASLFILGVFHAVINQGMPI